jgi:hypothetical protein
MILDARGDGQLVWVREAGAIDLIRAEKLSGRLWAAFSKATSATGDFEWLLLTAYMNVCLR